MVKQLGWMVVALVSASAWAQVDGVSRPVAKVGDVAVYAVEQRADKRMFDETVTVTSVDQTHIKSSHVRPIRNPPEMEGVVTLDWGTVVSGASGTRFDPPIAGFKFPLVVGDGTPGRQGSLTVDLGGVQVEIWHPGPGHTRGDTIAWVAAEKVLFSGDLVEYEAGVYTGDAQLEEWPATLEALRALQAEAIVPGRGEAMKGNANVNKALDYTQRWVTTLFQAGKEAVEGKMDLKAAMAHTRKSMDPVFGHVFIYEHCLPFDVSRAYDEAKGIKNPRIWTAERDKEMWSALQA